MIVDHDGRQLDVVDDDATRSWAFWEQFAAGEWEPFTLATIVRVLDEQRDGTDYLDLGAWVGPTVLAAAPHARRVRAVEPDPVAADVLRRNCATNAPGVEVIEAAAWLRFGTMTLATRGQFGDSMSSVMRRGASSVEVRTAPLEELIAGLDLALVKIDVEGAEGVLVTRYRDLLIELGCPILLSLHWPWVGRHGDALDAALASWTVELIDDSGRNGFSTVLLWNAR